MKYFTPEHYSRGNSPNAEDLHGIEDEWERAIRRYNRRWRKIKSAFPEGVRRFEQQHVCLHDAAVLSIGREDDTCVWLLETEPPACKPVVLTFTLEDEPAIQPHTGRGFHTGKPVRWLYEEWDLDRRQRPIFEVLLSNGWVVKLVFRDFHYLIAEPILSSANGQAAQPAGAPVPRSA
jgi:hypothetical protein